MPSVIKLKIQVDELANVLEKFDRIKVYRSTTGIGGTFVELTTGPTRITLVQGQELYEFDDTNGAITYYYKTSYFNSITLLESSLSDAQLGDDPSTANILTVQELKDIFLFGVDLTNDAGEPFPDIMFEWGIRQAIGYFERILDIKIRPTDIVERYDYYTNDYSNWTFIRLRQSPILKVNAVRVKWPSNTTVIDFPPEWIQVRKEEGQVNIVPTSGTLSQVLLTAGGSFLPLLASGQDFVPDILEVDYQAGFAEGQVPAEIREIIGMYASLGPFNVAGDLIAGAGIASSSIGIDGLSQSISTTSSATNAGYGARIIQYLKIIKERIPVLQRYYKGIRFAALG
jgi:hypothetical protein